MLILYALPIKGVLVITSWVIWSFGTLGHIFHFSIERCIRKIATYGVRGKGYGRVRVQAFDISLIK